MDRKVSSNNWASAFMCQWWQWVISVYSGVSDREIHIQFVLSLQPEVNPQHKKQEVLEQHENNHQENNRHWVSIIFTLSSFTGIGLHKWSRSKGCLHSKNWVQLKMHCKQWNSPPDCISNQPGVAAPRGTSGRDKEQNQRHTALHLHKAMAHCATASSPHDIFLKIICIWSQLQCSMWVMWRGCEELGRGNIP